jgi:hypothetical protein
LKAHMGCFKYLFCSLFRTLHWAYSLTYSFGRSFRVPVGNLIAEFLENCFYKND